MYVKVPAAEGVPYIVIVLLFHEAATPAGSPVAEPIPVAPVVACVILVKAVLIQSVGVDDAAATVLFGLTVKTPFTLEDPSQKPPPPAL